MPSHREEYVALLDERQLSSPVELEKERVREGAPSERATGSIHLVTTILCIFVLLDVAVYGYIVQLLRASNIDTGSLELRNSYIGLDELYHETTLVNSSRHEPIINLARRVGQVSSTDPHKPSPVDAHRMLTPFGLMAPPDRNLLVSSDVSQILFVEPHHSNSEPSHPADSHNTPVQSD
ncbi:hypothetical protein PHLCEN_2v4291 [Hermanssonia centrifuga]|uniref:Uncharacterized protein n=1 Tax=Hermanssonia centrifuga TaxID=98765 RepID=A0A2R6PVF8_9APHY|nr:hypothetical protein PHLCEN_2v4291 [Hermanssonia centrifuga]